MGVLSAHWAMEVAVHPAGTREAPGDLRRAALVYILGGSGLESNGGG